MAARYQGPRGTQDILPEVQPYWAAVHQALGELVRLFGFRRIDTPMFEAAGLFERGSGDTTDIVEKEMYVFEDRGGERLALTPEGTPAICRAYMEHGMASWPQPVRLYTTHPMFRYDRPQKGRYRQHTQFDCEVIGSADPLVDAEVITLLWSLFQGLGIGDITVRLGSIDDPEPRREYVRRLQEYYRPHLSQLSEDSQRRFERNPLRLLDSKDERDLPFKDDAPKLIDSLSPAAQAHHDVVTAALESAGVRYELDPLLVRGLDYYNRTVFEIVPNDDERAQNAMGGGGRYDGLIEALGGPPTPAMGFGSGIERIVLEMQRRGVEPAPVEPPAAFIAHIGEGTSRAAFSLAHELRSSGTPVLLGEAGRSLKSQMRSANHSGASVVAILGEDELARSAVILRPMHGEEQREVPLADASHEIRRLAGRT